MAGIFVGPETPEINRSQLSRIESSDPIAVTPLRASVGTETRIDDARHHFCHTPGATTRRDHGSPLIAMVGVDTQSAEGARTLVEGARTLVEGAGTLVEGAGTSMTAL